MSIFMSVLIFALCLTNSSDKLHTDTEAATGMTLPSMDFLPHNICDYVLAQNNSRLMQHCDYNEISISSLPSQILYFRFLNFPGERKNFIAFARHYQYLRNSDSILFSDIQIHCYSYSNHTDENSYHLSTKSLELQLFGTFFSRVMTFRCFEYIKTSHLGRETTQTIQNIV